MTPPPPPHRDPAFTQRGAGFKPADTFAQHTRRWAWTERGAGFKPADTFAQHPRHRAFTQRGAGFKPADTFAQCTWLPLGDCTPHARRHPSASMTR